MRKGAEEIRRLRPGPGQDPGFVAQDQRRRLQSAMAELVYEQGYGKVTVRMLLGRAHVTKPTFYRLFSGKEDCFLSAYEEVATTAVSAIAAATAGPGNRADLVRRGLETFVGTVTERPDVAYLAMLETLAVGSATTARMRRTEDEFARLTIERLAGAEDPVSLPAEVAQAVVAGVGRPARERLRAQPDLLRGDTEALSHWVLAVTEPAVRELAGIGVAPGPVSREGSRLSKSLQLLVPEERGLLIRAALRLAGEDGYAQLSPKRIAAAAGLPKRTFEKEFDDVDDCVFRALEVATVALVAEARRAFDAAPDWRYGMSQAVTALCRYLVSEPGFARIGFVEVFVPGRSVTSQGSAILNALARALRDRTPPDLRPDQTSAEASVGAIWALLRRRVVAGRIADVHRLAPTLSWLVLAPSIGGPEAIEVLSRAESSGAGR